MIFRWLRSGSWALGHCETQDSCKAEGSKSRRPYVKLQVSSIALSGMVGVNLAAVDELLGDAFIQAQVDEYHEFD